jgi:hypothetical protein
MTALCTNLRTEEMTQYDNFDFLAFGRLGNQVYGLKADGIYALGGDTDAGTRIDAHFKTITADQGNDDAEMNFKRLRKAYVEAFYAPIELTTYGDTVMTGTTFGNEKLNVSRAKAARGWSFRLANVGGEDAKITAFEVLYENAGRKT